MLHSTSPISGHKLVRNIVQIFGFIGLTHNQSYSCISSLLFIILIYKTCYFHSNDHSWDITYSKLNFTRACATWICVYVYVSTHHSFLYDSTLVILTCIHNSTSKHFPLSSCSCMVKGFKPYLTRTLIQELIFVYKTYQRY
jgi:hypothetical protein